jgi:hypothetical protein
MDNLLMERDKELELWSMIIIGYIKVCISLCRWLVMWL